MAVLNDLQSMVMDQAQGWIRDRMPVTAFRALRDAGAGGFDPGLWSEIADLGWCGVALSEEDGGSGLGHLNLGLILESLGRNVGATPLAATTVAADALAMAGSDALKTAWLPRLAAGEAIGALAVDEGAAHAPDVLATTAVRTEGGWRLDGVKRFVAEGMAADLLIVAAQAEGQTALFAVDAGAPGVSRAPRRLTDFRDHAEVTLSDVVVDADARLTGPDGDAALLDDLLDRARALAAAELLGLSVGAFDTTLEYLKTRVQFGQTIGAFQALQHRAADLYTRIELARSAVEAALSAIDAQAPDRALLVSIAKATAGDTANLATREMIQLHGGIGMTDDHDAGFYIKRARVLENSWGSAAWHRDRFGRLIGI
ncbi:acyl-CoA dehydrogenase family protein [Brevundimonas staleyi]|uniref:Acyl-CoA dehydrogenase family protein n=1 Tax=Brevundimonas staleyi TaxID=74326 RepID=A0ABW0FPC8_9CAUL